MKFSAFHSSRIGNRKTNQDRCSIFHKEDTVLLVLADGLGGHLGGELAAECLIDTMQEHFYKHYEPGSDPRTFLRDGVNLAHASIREIKTDNVKTPRTTCVCCLVENGKAIWLHSGDSRLYLFRNNRVYLRTRDHTYVEDLLQHRVISDEEVKKHPMRNYVTACLGETSPTPHTSISQLIELKPNDTLLLCSDGLWSAFDDDSLSGYLKKASLENAVDEMTEDSEQKTYPKSDNTTAIAFRYISNEKTVNLESELISAEDADEADVMEIDIDEFSPTDSAPASGKVDDAIDSIRQAFDLYEREIKADKN